MIAPGDSAPLDREYPVFVKRGDARGEVDALAREIGSTPSAAGLHKSIYAARADQTVVMVTDRDCLLATRLRARGWEEPRDSTDPPRD